MKHHQSTDLEIRAKIQAIPQLERQAKRYAKKLLVDYSLFTV